MIKNYLLNKAIITQVVFGFQLLLSQQLTGIVKSANTGELLNGANVTVEGTNKGAATDVNGYFKINLCRPG